MSQVWVFFTQLLPDGLQIRRGHFIKGFPIKLIIHEFFHPFFVFSARGSMPSVKAVELNTFKGRRTLEETMNIPQRYKRFLLHARMSRGHAFGIPGSKMSVMSISADRVHTPNGFKLQLLPSRIRPKIHEK